jgi:hypothetical protein
MAYENVSDRRRRVIRVNGDIELLDKPVPFADIEKLIGASSTDSVHLRHLGQPTMMMIVDDRGWETKTVHLGDGHIQLQPVRALKPVNVLATELYHANCHPGTTHVIVGDVLVCPDGDFA